MNQYVRRRSGLSLALALGLALPVSGLSVVAGQLAPAVAAPNPTPSPSAPSQEQVDAAARAVRQTRAQVEALQQQFAALQARVDALNTAAALATEKYDQAVIAKKAADAKAVAAAKALTAANQVSNGAKTKLDQLAAKIYMQGGSLSGMEIFLGADGAQEMADQASSGQAVTDYRGAMAREAAAAAQRASAAQRAAATAQLQAKAASETAATAADQAKKDVQAAVDQQKALDAQRQQVIDTLAKTQQISTDLAAKRAQALQDAAEKAAALAALKAAADREAAAAAAGGAATTVATAPARTKEAAAAIAFAKAHLGDPYVWAAAGPNTWDCSGLTLTAWAHGGATLPHSAAIQYQVTQRVAIADLQPGDLVFYGSSPATIHHVGLYIGGGQMIEAPHTGSFVRYSSIYRGDLLPYGGRV